MTRQAALLTALALPATGWAWEHEGAVWPSTAPIAVEVSDDPVPGLPSGYPLSAITAAFDAWTDHDCLDVSVAAVATSTDNPGSSVDGRSVFTMNDPFDQVPAGSWAVTVLEVGTTVSYTRDGIDYRPIVEADVVFSDTAGFATDAAIAAGCGDEISFTGVALHEVGHLLGLADSCPRGEACTDPAEQEATMNWLVPPCDTAASSLASDDLQGIAALYGPYVPFRCGPEQEIEGEPRVTGLVPFTADCAIDDTALADVDAVAWDFGDGTTGTGEATTHEYATAGRYDVTACFDAPALEGCSLFEACPARIDYVVACTPTEPVVGWDEVEGATIQLVNDTVIPAEGCFHTVSWTLYDTDGTTVLDAIEEWEPVYTFPGPGDYLAVLEIDGPAGYATAETRPHVSGERDDIPGDTDPICGCSASGPGGGIAAALVALLVARRRRPRIAALALLAAACTSRPDPVGSDVARAVALVDQPFAEIEVPPDNRRGVFPPDEMTLGPWTVVSGSFEWQRWETHLPMRVRSLFYYAPPDGMRLLDDQGDRVRFTGAADEGEPSWSYDGQSLRLEAPITDPAIPFRTWTLSWPVSQAREAAMNFAFSGAENPAEFARSSVQDGPDSRTGVLLPAPGKAAWDLLVPPAAELTFAPGVADPEVLDGPPSDGVRFTWEVVDGQATTVVWTDTRTPNDAFRDVRVDLSAWSGRSVRLRLRTDPLADPAFDYAFVGDPIVASRKKDPQRVVILFVDTLRPDHLGINGYERATTPTVDAWSAGATVFDSARSVAPWTLPTARSLVTGRHPEHYHTTETLPERLRKEGWATGMIAGNVYLSSNFEMQRDWGLHHVRHKPQAEEQVDLALRWLDDHADEDSLLMLHFMDVHLPYQEPPAYRYRFAGEAPEVLGEWFHRGTILRSPIGPLEEDFIRARYDGCVRYVDDQIARVLDVLHEDDIVLFLSDHGEEFWEHGDFEHGHTLYDEVLRVPLIVKAPGLPAGRVAEPVSLLDVTPTILDLLDLEPDGPLDGSSLVPAAKDEPGAREALLGRDQAFGRVLYGETRWGTLRGGEKYTVYAGTEAVYALDIDGGEHVNRLRSTPERAAEFRERLGGALGTDVRTGFRVLPNNLGGFPAFDLVVRLTVPGGVAAAFEGDDPTGASGAEIAIEGDTVLMTWPRRYRMMREVFVIPVAPYEQAAAGLDVEVRMGDQVASQKLEQLQPYRSEEPALIAVPVGGRTVRVNRTVIPVPFEGGEALQGFDAELSIMLQAMGYAVGDEAGGAGGGP